MRAVCVVFAATVNAFDPLPLPLTGGVIVIHGTPLVAVHAHSALVVIATLPGPPAAGIATDVGCSEMLQVTGAPDASVTVIVVPATTSVPVRTVPPLFATLKLTLPLPVPPAADTVIQLALLAAVHAQPAGPAIVAVPTPPVAVKNVLFTLTSNRHAEPS
jgi:hypothetical protein